MTAQARTTSSDGLLPFDQDAVVDAGVVGVEATVVERLLVVFVPTPDRLDVGVHRDPVR